MENILQVILFYFVPRPLLKAAFTPNESCGTCFWDGTSYNNIYFDLLDVLETSSDNKIQDGGPHHLIVDLYSANERRQKCYRSNFYYLLHQGYIY